MKFLRLFDAFISNTPEETVFLKMVKDKTPDLYNKFFSLVKNKGIDVAKDTYISYDPDIIKIKQQRDKKKQTKEIASNKRTEISDLMPNKSQIAYAIDEFLMTDEFRKLCQRLGAGQPSIKSCNYKSNVNQEYGKVTYSLYIAEHNTKDLNGLIQFLNRINAPVDLDVELARTINKNKISHQDNYFNDNGMEVSFFCEFELTLDRNNGFRITSFFKIAYHRFDDEFSVKKIIEIPWHTGRAKVDIVQIYDDNYNVSQKAISDTLVASVKKLNTDILNKREDAFSTVDDIEKTILSVCYDKIINSGNEAFKIINKIKSQYPEIYAKLEPLFNKKDINLASDMGDIGF